MTANETQRELIRELSFQLYKRADSPDLDAGTAMMQLRQTAALIEAAADVREEVGSK